MFIRWSVLSQLKVKFKLSLTLVDVKLVGYILIFVNFCCLDKFMYCRVQNFLKIKRFDGPPWETWQH